MELYCRRCGNTKQFKKTSKGYYCEACKHLGRFYIDSPIPNKEWQIANSTNSEYQLSYSLSEKQRKVASQIVEYSKQQDVLVYAACGAGKTEMVMPLITHCFKLKKKVGIAIPRKEVVIELQQRFALCYPKKSVIAVYGEQHQVIDGDLIICTTHQLFRYEKVFDVLIIDEVDAFPYANNAVLEGLVEFACKGQKVMLTATPSEAMIAASKRGEIQMVTLFERFHHGLLCVPEIVVGYSWYLFVRLMEFLYAHQTKTTLLFVPSIELADKYGKLLSYFFEDVLVLTSESKDRELLNREMKEHKYQIIVCTTVMERGITIGDVQVVVWKANHAVFNLASLIQISGRVGRKSEAREGDCLFLCERRCTIVEEAIASIKEMNVNA